MLSDSEVEHAERVMTAILREYSSATRKFGPFHSAHEGWAVIHEEMCELWEEVRKTPADRKPDAMRDEAVQVAAMALRFVVEIVDGGKVKRKRYAAPRGWKEA